MKRMFMFSIFAIGLFGFAAPSRAAVEYVRICDSYGSAFHFIPGTDICMNEETGETREATPGGVWFSVLPTNNQGHWTTSPRTDCAGRLVKVGPLRATDFAINAYNKFQAAPLGISLATNEFISKVIMSGGFSDPLQPLARAPKLSQQQFCLRVADPTFSTTDMGVTNPAPPFCTAAPLGCVNNSLIVGMPAAYSFSVSGAPVVHYNTDVNGVVIGAPATCGRQLVVTTGMGPYDPTKTSDPSQPGPLVPTGTLTVWACVEQGVSQWQLF